MDASTPVMLKLTSMRRLIITYERRGSLNPNEWIKERINIVHPDDPRNVDDKHKWNAWAQLGSMFKGNTNYRNVVYTTVEAAI